MSKRNPKLKKANVEVEFTPADINELKRCARDPVYFINTYVKIKHPIQGQIAFKLRDYQEALIRKFEGNQYNIILSARQTGKTETVTAYLLWFAIFNFDKTILVVSNKATNAKEIISKIQYAYEELPDFLKPGIDENSWNKSECAFDNKSRIISQATTKESGRGLPISLLYCDEFAFVKASIQQELWDSVSPTLATGGSCIISSTPNGDSNLFATLYRGSISNSNPFMPTHVPWDAAPGRDENFKKKQIALIGQKKWEQEYECSFLSAESMLIDGVVLANMEKYALANNQDSFTLGGQDFFCKPEKGKTFVVSVDPSTGSGNDNSAIEVFEFPSMKQVMEYRNNEQRPIIVYDKLKTLLNFLDKLGVVYFSVERNSVGEAILALYESDLTPPNGELLSEDGKGKLGFYTSDRVKLKYALKLKEMVERGSFKILSIPLITELKNYVRSGGSYAAQTGANDDCVSAMLIMVRMIEQMSMYDADAFGMVYNYGDMESSPIKIDADDEYDRDPYNDPNDGPLPILF